jgi:hypothetical protein
MKKYYNRKKTRIEVPCLSNIETTNTRKEMRGPLVVSEAQQRFLMLSALSLPPNTRSTPQMGVSDTHEKFVFAPRIFPRGLTSCFHVESSHRSATHEMFPILFM